MTDDELANVLKMVPFPRHLGFELMSCVATGAVTEALVTEEYTNGTTAHGGFLMTLADFTGAAAAYMAKPEGAVTSTTVESKTNMVASAPAGTRLRATSTPVHVGKRTSVWTTRVETLEGKLVSITTQTQMAI